MSKIIIYAPNVHSGGGAILLKELVRSCPPDKRIVFILDERYKRHSDVSGYINVIYFSSSISGRIKAELYLRKISTCRDHIVCLHNIPTVFNHKGKVTVFIQNRLIVDKNTRDECSYKAKVKLSLESWLVQRSRRRNLTYIVQTESMAQRLRIMLGVKAPDIQVLPFARVLGVSKNTERIVQTDYIYIASAEPHKNHRNLLEAWDILKRKYGQVPCLKLTIPQNTGTLNQTIKVYREKGLKIDNLGILSHEQVLEHLCRAKALIYPSKTESFGLPLSEAMSLNVPIIASELDYVRDVAAPMETFDPNSPLSIARAVARFEGIEEEPDEILSSESFWETIVR